MSVDRKPIVEMDREESIAFLCVLTEEIAARAFVEVFAQPGRISRTMAPLIGLEVKSKDAGLRMLQDLRELSTQIQVLSVNP